MSWCYVEPKENPETPYQRGGINLYPSGLETIGQYVARQQWGVGDYFLSKLHAGIHNTGIALMKAFPVQAEGKQKAPTTLMTHDIYVTSIPASAGGVTLIAVFTVKEKWWNEVFLGKKFSERETALGTKVLWSEVPLPWMTAAGMREYEVFG